MNISFSVDNQSYMWSKEQVVSRLKGLKEAGRFTHWIRSDLTTESSSIWARGTWLVVKHFECLRRLLFGVDLEHSKKILTSLRAGVCSFQDQQIYQLYLDAVAKFEMIAPNHSLLGRKSLKATQERCDGEVNPDIVSKTVKKLNQSKPKGVHFQEPTTTKPLRGGICSALCLQLINEYLHSEKVNTKDEFEKQIFALVNKVKKASYDKRDSKTLRSIQRAYNSIVVDDKEVDHSFAKMQGLANHYDRKLGYHSRMYDIENDDITALSEEVDKLKCGIFLMRVIQPLDNQKMEYRGHSLVFIRSEFGDYLYDPNTGINEVEQGKAAEKTYVLVKKNHYIFNVSQTRFYQVS